MRFLLSLALCATCAIAAPRVTISFNDDWRFLKSDAAGAEKADFNDAAWRTVTVPHDWSIEGPFDEKNPTGGAGAFLPAGTGWYRRHFSAAPAWNGRRVFIEFDGVMANSDVWINGEHLGKRPYGYVSFRYEMTGKLKPENVLAVRCDNSAQPASRWYAGAGIYRNVRLVVTDPVHIDQWGTFVTTPKATAAAATVHVASSVVNQSGKERTVAMQVVLVDPRGKAIATRRTKPIAVAAGKAAGFEEAIEVGKPELWDLGHPAMYKLVATVVEGENALDLESTPFGIRDAHFDAATGFWLNGRNFKLKGVCLHQEVGGLGIAVPDRAWERRIASLQQLGVNAIRTAHNPPSPSFLDICDRMGVLVMDELFDQWTVAKNPYDYHLYFREWSKIDVRDTVKRDRNHPSVILYSAGNEIRDTPKQEMAKEILRGLVDTFHEFDPSRPVTQALFRPNASRDYDDGLADMLDVIGQNYRENEILKAHEDKPSRKIVGTENGHDRSIWLALRDHPAYAGQFLWTGTDYLGESRQWPIVGAGSGLLDRTGAIKPAGLERASWWSEQPVVHMARRVARAQATPQDPGFTPLRRTQTVFADWTPSNLDAHEESVEVYSNCDEVELLLNGKSLGSKPINADASPRAWTVPFEAGLLRAIGKSKGAIVASEELRTAGLAAKVALSVDRPKLSWDWNDVAYVTARVVDTNGITIPGANNLVQFKVSGPGVIAAVDNADNSSHEMFQASLRHAYEGECVAIIRAGGSGRIVITASAEGLEGGSVAIEAAR
jgi:beta-galactosidase